ncbi:MAG: hydrogen peroxide-inducible genes activator [Micrococcales bacterium]|nr:hydrogen peroxide-inducible genes activator [Micrococcales bacterium]
MSNHAVQPTRSGLRAFVAVAEHRRFHAAAAAVGVSQPSLSQALAALETTIGLQLVERHRRQIMLTPDGAQLLPLAQAALDAYDDFCTAAAGCGDPLAGRLHLGMIPTVAPYVLPVVLPGLAERYPDLTLTLVEDQTARLLNALRDGRIDTALLALPVPGVVEIPMYDEDFVLALPAGHHLSGRTDLSLSVLDDLPLLLLAEGHCLRDQALAACQQADVHPITDSTRATSLPTVLRCVAGNLGVTLLPATAAASETATGALTTAAFTDPPGRRIGLVHRPQTGRDAAYRALAATMTDIIAATGPVHSVVESTD